MEVIVVVVVLVAMDVGSWVVVTAGLCICIFVGFWVNILFNVL